MADFACPFCMKPINEAQSRGSHCPHCGQQLRVEVPQTGSGRASVRSAGTGSATARWGSVRAGLMLLFCGSVFLVAVRLGAYLILYVMPALGMWNAEALMAGGLRWVLLVGFAFATVLIVIGVLLCCAAPREGGTRVWAVLLLFTIALPITVGLAIWFGDLQDLFRSLGLHELDLDKIFIAFALVFVLLALLWMVMMLRALARSGSEDELGASFVNWFVVQVFLYIGYIIGLSIIYGSLLPPKQDVKVPVLGLLCGGCGEILTLLLLVWWARLLWRLRATFPSLPEELSLRRR